jgi:hypothetical protein
MHARTGLEGGERDGTEGRVGGKEKGRVAMASWRGEFVSITGEYTVGEECREREGEGVRKRGRE